MMMEGIVKKYGVIRGYGFIVRENMEYFVHISSINLSDEEKTLLEGERVHFVPSKNEKGLIAKSVCPVEQNRIKRVNLLSKNKARIVSYRIMKNNKLYDSMARHLGEDFQDTDRESIKNIFENAYNSEKNLFVFQGPDGVKIALFTEDLQKNLSMIMPLIKEILTKRRVHVKGLGVEFEAEEQGDSFWGQAALAVGGVIACALAGAAIAILNKDS